MLRSETSYQGPSGQKKVKNEDQDQQALAEVQLEEKKTIDGL